MCLFRGSLTDFKLKKAAKNPLVMHKHFFQTGVNAFETKREKFYDGGAARSAVVPSAYSHHQSPESNYDLSCSCTEKKLTAGCLKYQLACEGNLEKVRQ
jgi:hypothetical protein